MSPNTIILSCSIFRAELEYLKNTGKIHLPVFYLDSLLHMNPQKLEKLLNERLDTSKDKRILLLYGDCHANMIDYEKLPNILRSPGINCCEIFLGKEQYHKLRKEGAFIILHEWAHRWKEVFIDNLGFSNLKTSKLFMNDMHKKITYIDTSLRSIPYDYLKEISDYFGLPLEIYPCSLENLENTILNLLSEKST